MTLRYVSLILFLRKRPMTNLMTESNVVVQSKYVIGASLQTWSGRSTTVLPCLRKESCSCSIKIQCKCCRVSVTKLYFQDLQTSDFYYKRFVTDKDRVCDAILLSGLIKASRKNCF